MKKIFRTIVFILTLLTLTGCGSKTVDLKELFNFEFNGYNQYSKFTYYVNEESKAFEIMQKAEDKDDSYRWLNAAYAEIEEETDHLSNGDKIHIKFIIDEDQEKEKNSIKLKNIEFDLEVSGLQEVETFSYYDEININLTGRNHKGKLIFDCHDEEYLDAVDTEEIEYELDEYGELNSVGYPSDLCNGAVVKSYICLDYEQAKDYFETYGKLPKYDTKEITISGLGDIYSKLTDISEDIVSNVKEKAENILKEEYLEKRLKTTSGYEYEYVEKVLFFQQYNDSYAENNFELVYKVTEVFEGHNITYYITTSTINLYENMNKDEIVVELNIAWESHHTDIPGYSTQLVYYGYDDLDELNSHFDYPGYEIGY